VAKTRLKNKQRNEAENYFSATIFEGRSAPFRQVAAPLLG